MGGLQLKLLGILQWHEPHGRARVRAATIVTRAGLFHTSSAARDFAHIYEQQRLGISIVECRCAGTGQQTMFVALVKLN